MSEILKYFHTYYYYIISNIIKRKLIQVGFIYKGKKINGTRDEDREWKFTMKWELDGLSIFRTKLNIKGK